MTTGVSLSGTTSKNRAAGSNSLLITNLGATGAIAQFVQNTTHPSNAWVYKSLGANSFDMTQPLVASTIGGTDSPAEVDTWANTDSVNLTTLCNINLALVRPATAQGFGAMTLFQFSSFDPPGIGSSILTIDSTSSVITVQEVTFQKIVSFANASLIQSSFTNCLFQSGFDDAGSVILLAGATGPNAFTEALSNTGGNDSSIDGDFILGGLQANFSGLISTGFFYLDQSVNATAGTMWESLSGLPYGGNIIYGSAGKNIDLEGHSHFALISGTFTSTFTAPALITGILMNGVANACSHTNANNPDVWNCAITTTPAHLDAAQGTAGFGGLAAAFSGAVVASHD